jgi:hypothetical protein
MTDFLLNEAWKLLGWGTLFVAAVVWLSKSIASHWLERRLKHLDAQLQSRTEEIKSQLDHLSTEHEVRFSLLHAKRADVISELWEKIANVHSHTLALTFRAEEGMALDLSHNSAEAAFEAVRATAELLQKRKIWLSESLVRRIEDLVFSELSGPSLKYHSYLQSRCSASEVIEIAKRWGSKSSEISQLISGLERDFRNELGVVAHV